MASDIPAGFVRPFRFDGWEYIFDADGRMAADFAPAIRARGWGRIQHEFDDPCRVMLEWEVWLNSRVGGAEVGAEVVEILNKETTDER